MATLSALSAIGSESGPESPLAKTLSILFEHSPVLVSTLEPQLANSLSDAYLASYTELIDKALAIIVGWDRPLQAQFISGHPRIGETKNLSTLSAKEQGAARSGSAATPPEVLARLAHLNACYEARYPGLRYITFVNGRTRKAIAEEMEDKLGFEHSLSPDTPLVADIDAIDSNSEEWMVEDSWIRIRRRVGHSSQPRVTHY
ncbi:putative OHCU decarboxylase [Lyophyllum shimeji]|uniref:OHCU decarboxylase n=1 Tax=Lyophyllum shimeji TaxID=47721 RepID=A0A9P3URV3_LYOSH|nr:putative OHCU decarboxylase [Lyophyllum shimeji]